MQSFIEAARISCVESGFNDVFFMMSKIHAVLPCFSAKAQMRSIQRIVCLIDSFGPDQKTKLKACALVAMFNRLCKRRHLKRGYGETCS